MFETAAGGVGADEEQAATITPARTSDATAVRLRESWATRQDFRGATIFVMRATLVSPVYRLPCASIAM